MVDETSIVYPIKGKNDPDLCGTAVMISAGADFQLFRETLNIAPDMYLKFLNGRILPNAAWQEGISLAGPIVGAPYAVMGLELLSAWGAERFIFYGWCGSIDENIEIGDVVVPSAAVIDEGTSLHYHGKPGMKVYPDPAASEALAAQIADSGLTCRRGAVWTTDGIFRETPEKVRTFQRYGACVVEMEVSALFCVAAYLKRPLSAVLVVSDTLSGGVWRTGFKDARFLENRVRMVEVIRKTCQRPEFKNTTPPSESAT
jgi:purine-nucleoside phosphorylase